MKVKFTQKDLAAIELVYWNNEGDMPCNIEHVPKDREYQVLQELWLRMAERIEKGDKIK